MTQKDPQKCAGTGSANDVGSAQVPETRPTSIRLSDDLRALIEEVRPGTTMAGFLREAATFYIGYLAAREGHAPDDVEGIMRRLTEGIKE